MNNYQNNKKKNKKWNNNQIENFNTIQHSKQIQQMMLIWLWILIRLLNKNKVKKLLLRHFHIIMFLLRLFAFRSIKRINNEINESQ